MTTEAATSDIAIEHIESEVVRQSSRGEVGIREGLKNGNLYQTN